jgi:3-methyladenine DNA glycosylase AlkD
MATRVISKSSQLNTVGEVLSELERKGSEQTCKTYARHGINIPMYGVSVADLKIIAKRIRGNQALALKLFDTGNYDAMYLAGMVADGSQMSKKQLQQWATDANCEAICGYTVTWVATESPFARELAMKWIDSKKASIAIIGWATYSGIVATTVDENLNLDEIEQLLDRVLVEIDKAPNMVRYMMNGFVIAVGGYVKPLSRHAKRVAKSLGTVSVDMGDTACKVPRALDYIQKIEKLGRVGKKRKTMRC